MARNVLVSVRCPHGCGVSNTVAEACTGEIGQTRSFSDAARIARKRTPNGFRRGREQSPGEYPSASLVAYSALPLRSTAGVSSQRLVKRTAIDAARRDILASQSLDRHAR